jgi:hypothetical protein
VKNPVARCTKCVNGTDEPEHAAAQLQASYARVIEDMYALYNRPVVNAYMFAIALA